MKTVLMLVLMLAAGLVAAGLADSKPQEQSGKGAAMPEIQKNLQTATLAGGCFWCVEADFEKLPGVVEAISGYTGGRGDNPTYENYGQKGHVEAVQVVYDPAKVSYQALLDYFWRHVDPTDPGGQFVDRGAQYRSVIFYHDAEQQRLAEASKQALEKSKRFSKPIVTEILPLTKFLPGRGLPPGLLQDPRREVQILPLEFRPGSIYPEGLGQGRSRSRRARRGNRNMPSPVMQNSARS